MTATDVDVPKTRDSQGSEKRRVRSYSQLHTFMDCPELYRLERIVKVPTPQAVWFPAGTAFHSVTEASDLALHRGTIAPDVAELWTENFEREVAALKAIEPDVTKWRRSKQNKPTKKMPNGEDLDWWAANGPKLCQQYVDWRKQNPKLQLWSLPNGEPALELKLETEYGGVPYVGYIDKVFRDVDTGALLVVDLKSGSRMPDSSLQLGTYGAGIGQVHGEVVWYGAFYDARKGKLDKVHSIDQWTANALGELFFDMDSKVNAGIFKPRIGKHCNWCIMNKQGFCKYQGGKEPLL